MWKTQNLSQCWGRSFGKKNKTHEQMNKYIEDCKTILTTDKVRPKLKLISGKNSQWEKLKENLRRCELAYLNSTVAKKKLHQ